MKYIFTLFLTLVFSSSILGAKIPDRKAPIEHRWQMTIEKFVHLSQTEKNEVLIKTMELMVELEGKYHKEITKNENSSNETLKKYVHILKQIKNFLLSEAVAADFADLGKDYVSLMNELGPKACIYAGWVSSVYEDKKGNFFCLHPSKSGNAKVRAIYNLANPASNKCDSSKIACNPMVFGFKKFDKKTTFCVDTTISGTTNKSHNAAYSCMKQALDENPKDAANQDTKEKRLITLSDAVSSSTEAAAAFNTVHDYIFKSCLCEEAPSDIKMHAKYRSYIRPHRTCLGMIQSLKGLNSSACKEFSTKLTDANYLDFINKWDDFFKKNSPPANMTNYSFTPDQDIEKKYKELIDSSEVKAYCKGELPKPTVTEEDKKSYTCSVKCKSVESKGFDCYSQGGFKIQEILTNSSGSKATDIAEDLFKEELKNVSSIDDKNKFLLKLKDYPEITCDAEIEKPADKPKPVCKTTCQKTTSSEGKEILTCAVSISTTVDGKEQSITMNEESEKSIPTDLTGKTEFTIKVDNQELVCPVNAPPAQVEVGEEEKKVSCEIKFNELEGDEKETKVKASVTFSGIKDNKDPESFSWSEGTPDEQDKKVVTLEKKTEVRKVSVLFGSKDTEKCEADVPTLVRKEEDKETKKYTIEVKAETFKDTDSNISLKAIVKDEAGKEVSKPAGYKISWTRNGAGVSKIKAPAKDETAAIQDEPKDDKTVVPSGQFAEGESISAQRVDEDYNVVASLLDESGKEVSKDDEKVPLLKSSTTKTPIKNNYNNGYPQRPPPVFQFNPFNTSTKGIQ